MVSYLYQKPKRRCSPNLAAAAYIYSVHKHAWRLCIMAFLYPGYYAAFTLGELPQQPVENAGLWLGTYQTIVGHISTVAPAAAPVWVYRQLQNLAHNNVYAICSSSAKDFVFQVFMSSSLEPYFIVQFMHPFSRWFKIEQNVELQEFWEVLQPLLARPDPVPRVLGPHAPKEALFQQALHTAAAEPSPASAQRPAAQRPAAQRPAAQGPAASAPMPAAQMPAASTKRPTASAPMPAAQMPAASTKRPAASTKGPAASTKRPAASRVANRPQPEAAANKNDDDEKPSKADLAFLNKVFTEPFWRDNGIVSVGPPIKQDDEWLFIRYKKETAAAAAAVADATREMHISLTNWTDSSSPRYIRLRLLEPEPKIFYMLSIKDLVECLTQLVNGLIIIDA